MKEENISEVESRKFDQGEIVDVSAKDDEYRRYVAKNTLKEAYDEKFHTINISLGSTIFYGKVELDGKQIKGIRKISMSADLESPTVVTIEMIANVNMDGKVDEV
jgi:hypothetical protein